MPPARMAAEYWLVWSQSLLRSMALRPHSWIWTVWPTGDQPEPETPTSSPMTA